MKTIDVSELTASELEPYWPIGVDAVEIVRDVRHEL